MLMERIANDQGHAQHMLDCVVCRKLFFKEVPELMTIMQGYENATRLLVEGITTKNDIMKRKGELALITWATGSDKPVTS